jgi:predicted oxidoreductase
MLAGVKHQCSDDDALLDAAGTLLNHLYAAYAQAAFTGGAQC